VNNPTALRKKCRQIFIRYKQPAVIESFLEGSEITAGVCGNLPFPGLLGMMKIIPKNVSEKFFLYSLENKRDWENRIHYEGQSSISPGIQTRVKTCSLKAFTVLELRDIARIDFRIGKDRIPRIIDVNPLPGLSPVYGDLPILCRLSGKSYRELIYRLIAASFERYGFNPPDRHSSKGTA
jgi:D-alanine-D-alanine ligase